MIMLLYLLPFLPHIPRLVGPRLLLVMVIIAAAGLAIVMNIVNRGEVRSFFFLFRGRRLVATDAAILEIIHIMAALTVSVVPSMVHPVPLVLAFLRAHLALEPPYIVVRVVQRGRVEDVRARTRVDGGHQA